MNTQGTSGRSVTVALPADVIDKDGKALGSFRSMTEAYAWANAYAPGGQDNAPDGQPPNGWDIQVCP